MVLEHHFNYNGESSPLECIAKWWSETMANKWWVITIPIQWRMVQGHHFTCNGESSPVECIENGDQKPWPKNGEWSPFTHNEDGVGTLFYWQMVRVHHLNTLKMVIKHHDPQMVSDHHSSHGFYGAEKPFIRKWWMLTRYDMRMVFLHHPHWSKWCVDTIVISQTPWVLKIIVNSLSKTYGTASKSSMDRP